MSESCWVGVVLLLAANRRRKDEQFVPVLNAEDLALADLRKRDRGPGFLDVHLTIPYAKEWPDSRNQTQYPWTIAIRPPPGASQNNRLQILRMILLRQLPQLAHFQTV